MSSGSRLPVWKRRPLPTKSTWQPRKSNTRSSSSSIVSCWNNTMHSGTHWREWPRDHKLRQAMPFKCLSGQKSMSQSSRLRRKMPLLCLQHVLRGGANRCSLCAISRTAQTAGAGKRAQIWHDSPNEENSTRKRSRKPRQLARLARLDHGEYVTAANVPTNFKSRTRLTAAPTMNPSRTSSSRHSFVPPPGRKTTATASSFESSVRT